METTGNVQESEERYSAIISSIPEISVEADSPGVAIERLQMKLRALSRYYRMSGKMMPELDNPVQPPRNRGSARGWISVYVRVVDCHNSNSVVC